jgi:methionyl-tRNA formyltransferase
MLNNKPSVVFMGSKPGSVVALSILLKQGWDVKYVVVSKKIKHPWIGGQTLEQFAKSNALNVVTQSELPRKEKVDFVLSYMFRYRVKSDVISMANRAALNFHAGPLPEFGGWAFYNIAILENAREYGCTCHYIDDGFDTGPLFKVNRFPIDACQETAISLEKKTQEEMIRLFKDFVHIAENHDVLPMEEQDHDRMRYLSKDEFELMKQIPCDANAETIDRYARAFWYPPYECAYLKIGLNKVEVTPLIVKNQLATLLHANDLEQLQKIAVEYQSGR